MLDPIIKGMTPPSRESQHKVLISYDINLDLSKTLILFRPQMYPYIDPSSMFPDKYADMPGPIELPSIPSAVIAIQSLIMDTSPGNTISCYSNPELNNGR